MKIAVTAYHNPNFLSYSEFLEYGVVQAGHTALPFEDRNFVIPGRLRSKFPLLHDWDLARINKNFLRYVKQTKPDLCIVTGGDRISVDVVHQLKAKGIITVLWTTDAPIFHWDKIAAASRHYDFVFCAGSEHIRLLKKENVLNTYLLPFAADPDHHKPVEPNGEKKPDDQKKIVFVGSYYPNRARVLESIADLDIGVWGPSWDKLDQDSPLAAKAEDAQVTCDRWTKIYGAADIVLVIHFRDEKIPCDQCSPKLFEALMSKRLVLVDQQEDVNVFFKDKEHLVYFEDEEDLRKKIEYYLSHPKEREQIAYNGYQEILKKHLYKHRIEEMLTIIKHTR